MKKNKFLITGAVISILVLSSCNFVSNKEQNSSEVKIEQPISAEQKLELVQSLSDNIWNTEFYFDNRIFKLQTTYDKFAEAGWVIPKNLQKDVDAKRLEGGYMLELPMFLDKEKYRKCELPGPNLGFVNISESYRDILDCDIYLFSIGLGDIDKSIAPYPDFEMAKGISWESTLDEIKKAYGDPTDIIRNEKDKCNTLIYKKDAIKILLKVYDSKGLVYINFSVAQSFFEQKGDELTSMFTK